MVLVGWVSFQLWLVSNKIVWLFGFLCLEFGSWVVWQGWTKRANNNILRWSKLPWMQLLFRLDDSYSLQSIDILPLINFSLSCLHIVNKHCDLLFFVVRDLRWYLVSQPNRPDLNLLSFSRVVLYHPKKGLPRPSLLRVQWTSRCDINGPTRWGQRKTEGDKPAKDGN